MKLEKKVKTLESENKLVLLFVFITVVIINKINGSVAFVDC